MPLTIIAMNQEGRVLDRDYVLINDGLNELDKITVDKVFVGAVVNSVKDVDMIIEILNGIKSKF